MRMPQVPRWSGTRRWALKTGAAALTVCATGTLAAASPQVLRRGNGAEPDTLDPHLASGDWENNIIGDLFLGLTTENIHGRPIPGCAESWTTSDDGLVWTFKLRPGLVWSDGVPISAADFVWSWRRILDPKTAARYAFILYVVQHAEEINAGKRPLEDLGIRALDDLTLEVTLGQPAPFLPGLLKHYTSFAVPRHAFDKHGRAWVQPGNMVSNGAYVLAEHVPNSYIKLVKNPRFFDAANVVIEEVLFYPIDDERSALTRYRAGEIDMNIASNGFPIQQLDWLQQNMPGQARIYPRLTVEYVFTNMRRPPFDDIRLRRALNLMIDRDLLVEKVKRDGSAPAASFVPHVVDNYVQSARFDFADWPMERRKAEAIRLLAEAGYGPERPLTFEFQYRSSYDRRRLYVAMSAIWKDAHIIARMAANESRVHYNRVQQDDFVVAEGGWVGDYNDPQTFLSLIETSAGVFNYPGYSNPRYDRLMSDAKVMLDMSARAAVMAQAEQIALDECAVMPFNFVTSKNLVSPRIEGFEDNAENTHRTRWMRMQA